MLTQEQSKQVKQEIISQIEKSNIPDKNKVKSQIQSMNDEQLEQFMKQQQGLLNNQENRQCIFCSIVSGQTPSYKIDESPEAIAVLELNPISKGHSIIIPKTHSEEISKEVFNLEEKISKKLSQIFNPKKIEIVESSLFGHKIINVFPIYENETVHTQRKQGNQEELQELQRQISNLKIPETIEVKEKKLPELTKPKKEIYTDKDTWLPKRIP